MKSFWPLVLFCLSLAHSPGVMASDKCNGALGGTGSSQKKPQKQETASLSEQHKPTLQEDRTTTTFPVKPVWAKQGLQNYRKFSEINGFLVELVSDYFLKKQGKLPGLKHLQKLFMENYKGQSNVYTELITEKGLKHYFSLGVHTPNSISHIFQVSGKVRRELYISYKADFKSKRPISKFFSEHLKTPSLKELAEFGKTPLYALDLVLPNITLDFRKNAVAELSPDAVARARTLLAKAFARAVNQTHLPMEQRTRPTTPSLSQLYGALVATAESTQVLPKPLREALIDGVFTKNDLALLLGMKAQTPRGRLTTPVLFEGIAGLESFTRQQHPTAFKGYVPGELLESGRFEKFLEALNEKQGFLVTSINAGIETDWPQWVAMARYAEFLDYDIIIIPTAGILDGIPEVLLNHKRVHILTHTLENKHLKLWSIPILPKNMNSLASLNNPGQHEPMQSIIVGHPQLRLMLVPTSTNHLRSTSLWSTGSLSLPLYPYRHPVQGRTGAIAENSHNNGFLVLEKADGEAGFSGKGVPNYWHTRPVYVVKDPTDSQTSFTDRGKRYSVLHKEEGEFYIQKDVKVSHMAMDTLVLGDLHERVADPVFMGTLLDLITSPRGQSLKRIVLHDPIDGGSHNRHEAQRWGLLIEKFMKGELDYHGEMMALVSFINALTTAHPTLQVVMDDSNHSYWGKQLLDQAGEVQSVVNGRFLDELRNARHIYGVTDPLTYVFQYRNDYLSRLPEEAKARYMGEAVLLEHPERVRVLPYGRNFVVGPPHRETFINFHGHQGANGSRGSPKAHAIGSRRAITGDSHQSAILGQWMSVGTSTPPRVGFNDGGYSAWSNSFAVIYQDGSKQLFIYSSETESFENRLKARKMESEEFFGEYKMEVIPNSNDLSEGGIADQHSHVLGASSKNGRKDEE